MEFYLEPIRIRYYALYRCYFVYCYLILQNIYLLHVMVQEKNVNDRRYQQRYPWILLVTKVLLYVLYYFFRLFIVRIIAGILSHTSCRQTLRRLASCVRHDPLVAMPALPRVYWPSYG